MIGIVIVTHNNLGTALLECAAFITGADAPNAIAVSINLSEDPDKLRQKIQSAIKSIDCKNGVLLLTDMFGGTPSNLSYSFLKEGQVEVLSGVNLPIVIKAINDRDKKSLADLAADIETFGKRSISLASGILKGKTRN